MSRLVYLGIAAATVTMAIGFTGCCSRGGYGNGGVYGFIDNFMQEQVACMQEKVWAKRAFHLRFGHCERIHADHFRDGFVAGYCNVCDGKGGEMPALPPEKYWGFQYRNMEGAEMQNAWFAGFEQGAESARTDGSGSFHEIQISRQLEEAMLEAEQIEMLHSGITTEIIEDAVPVRQGITQQPQPAIPQTNSPYIPESVPTLNPMPMESAPLAPSIRVPGTPAGFGSEQPMADPPLPSIPRATGS